MQCYGAKQKADIMLLGNVMARHTAGDIYALITLSQCM